jgi:hypothetical protein
MDREDFEDLKDEVLEILEEDVGDSCEYHKIILGGPPDGSPVNTDFGFVDQDNTSPDTDPDKTLTEVTRLFLTNHEQAQNLGLIKRLGVELGDFRVNYEIVVYFATREIENKELVLERDAGFLRFDDGTEWRIEAIVPVPSMFGSSIMHRLVCSKRKPLDDKPGIN